MSPASILQVTFSVGLRGSARTVRKNGLVNVAGCRRLGGTSAASPVVAGAVTLLSSSIPEELRACMLNPASMKQVLIESARPIKGTALPEQSKIASIFEQGAGLMNLPGAHRLIQQMQVEGTKATIHPSLLDFTDCPYMWPYCAQPLYHSAMPVMANLTVLNGMGVVGNITAVRWSQTSETPTIKHTSSGGGSGSGSTTDNNGSGHDEEKLNVQWKYSEILYPYTGHFSIYLTVPQHASTWSGVIEGDIEVDIYSDGDPTHGCLGKVDCWFE